MAKKERHGFLICVFHILDSNSLKPLVSDTRFDSVSKLIDTVIQGIMQQIASPTIVVNLPEEMKVVTYLRSPIT